jgi:hypothetical protein
VDSLTSYPDLAGKVAVVTGITLDVAGGKMIV